jgi:hypothetical protein
MLKAEDPRLSQISSIVSEYMKDSQLPVSYYTYIANMILEEPPRQADDLHIMIQDFATNNIKYGQEHARRLSTSIFEELNKK